MMFVWIFIVAFLMVTFLPNSKKENNEENKTAQNRTRAILQERFASGEISHQEYLHMLDTLETL